MLPGMYKKSSSKIGEFYSAGHLPRLENSTAPGTYLNTYIATLNATAMMPKRYNTLKPSMSSCSL